MVYEAETLKELLRINWSLTGLLSAEGSVAAQNNIRPIKFFAREQLDEKIETKSIEVHKESPLATEDNNEFFTNETDEFKVRVNYKLNDTSKNDWDLTESNVEDIEEEIERIIRTTYNPQTGIGVFFTSNFNWRDVDQINTPKQEEILVRELTLRLTRIKSRSASVFDSFQRGLFFDVSASSNMNSPPGADKNYTEVFDITENEGFRARQLPVTDHPDGPGVQIFYAGAFDGTLIMNSKLAAGDVGSSSDRINQIRKRQNNGEYIEAAIVSTYTNNASQTLTITRIVVVTDVRVVEGMSNLLEWQISAKILKPTSLVIT